MRIVVTGVSGRIGSAVADAVLGAGHDLVGLDRVTPPVRPEPGAALLRAAFGTVPAGAETLDGNQALISTDRAQRAFGFVVTHGQLSRD